jgi:hypothetical protein
MSEKIESGNKCCYCGEPMPGDRPSQTCSSYCDKTGPKDYYYENFYPKEDVIEEKKNPNIDEDFWDKIDLIKEDIRKEFCK